MLISCSGWSSRQEEEGKTSDDDLIYLGSDNLFSGSRRRRRMRCSLNFALAHFHVVEFNDNCNCVTEIEFSRWWSPVKTCNCANSKLHNKVLFDRRGVLHILSFCPQTLPRPLTRTGQSIYNNLIQRYSVSFCSELYYVAIHEFDIGITNY